MAQKTACVGCHLSRFCTLEDVVSTYEKDGSEFFAELEKVMESLIQS